MLLINRFGQFITNDIWSNSTIPIEYMESRTDICGDWAQLALNKGVPLWFFITYSHKFTYNNQGDFNLYLNPSLPLSFYATRDFPRWNILATRDNATGKFFEQHDQLTPQVIDLLRRNRAISQSFWDARPHIISNCMLWHRWPTLSYPKIIANEIISLSIVSGDTSFYFGDAKNSSKESETPFCDKKIVKRQPISCYELSQLESLDSWLWTTNGGFDRTKWRRLTYYRHSLPEIVEEILQSVDSKVIRQSILNSMAANKLLPLIYRERQVAIVVNKILN